MALADSVSAIGAVTDTLVERLGFRTKLQISVGRPEPPTQITAAGRLNLFLYEVSFDATLKNIPLDDGQSPPLWLVLKYLLTAFGDDGTSSDSITAHDYLGVGVGALQEFSFLPLTPPLASVPHINALKDNPEDLKITFDEAPLDLLAKAMQGSDEKYRLSIAFQVRPVMIAPAELPSYSQLVGVDYTTNPVTLVGEKDIHVAAIPSLGPVITKIDPASCQIGDTVSIIGTDLHLSNLAVSFGPVMLPVTMQQPDRLQFVVRDDVVNGSTISAGSLPVSVSQLLPSGRRRSSNLLVAGLRPIFSATIATVHTVTAIESPPPEGWKFATLDLTGELLGKNDEDDFYLALYKDGVTVKIFENDPSVTDPLGHLRDTSLAGELQTAKQLVMLKPDSVPPGKYLVLYRVNGQQALQGPEIDLT